MYTLFCLNINVKPVTNINEQLILHNRTYNQYLEIAKKEIECELAGESNKDVPLDVLVKSYIRYVQSFKKLEVCLVNHVIISTGLF